jgi:hypothetical protein
VIGMAASRQARRLKTFGAPDVRVLRGDVTEETRLEISKTGRTGTITVHVVNDWLRRYHRKGYLSREQFAAGQRFQEVCEGLDVGVRSQLAKLLDRGGGDASIAMLIAGEAANHARFRYGKAVHAMGAQLAPVAVWVIVAGRSAKSWAEAVRRPAEDGMALLRSALNALVDHYQLREGLDR